MPMTPEDSTSVKSKDSASIKPIDSASENSPKILIDASRDGGVWWFPQGTNAQFYADQYHQGTTLVQYLVGLGYSVDELPRGQMLTLGLLRNYSRIIRVVGFGVYTDDEIQAYDDFLSRKGSLLLLQDHLANSSNDNLSAHLGVNFQGILSGTVTVFTSDSITAGVTGLSYIAGSVVTNAANNPNMTVIGSFDNSYFLDLNNDGIYNQGELQGPPVMGKITNYPGKVFFLGDTNGLESVPQPFTQNLVNWLFRR
jgi:hypothetical protein